MVEILKESFLKSIKIQKESNPDYPERYRVYNPFFLEDGDHLSIVIKKINNDWYVSDEGFTHSRHFDFFESKVFYKPSKSYIREMIREFEIENIEGQFMKKITEENQESVIFQFAQGLITINTIVKFC